MTIVYRNIYLCTCAWTCEDMWIYVHTLHICLNICSCVRACVCVSACSSVCVSVPVSVLDSCVSVLSEAGSEVKAYRSNTGLSSLFFNLALRYIFFFLFTYLWGRISCTSSLSIVPYVAIDGLTFLVLWPLLPEQWWNCRRAPACPVYATLGREPRARCMLSKLFYQAGPQSQRAGSPKPSTSSTAALVSTGTQQRSSPSDKQRIWAATAHYPAQIINKSLLRWNLFRYY